METTQPTTITELPNLPIPIISVSSEGIILSVNPQAIRDFGGEQKDLVNKSVNDLLSNQKTPDALHALFFGTAKAAKRFEKDQTDETRYPEIRIRTIGKGDRIVQIRPKFIVEGEIKSGFEIVVVDITEQKQAEALAKAAELLSKDLSFEEIMKNMREVLQTLVPHDTANIMILDDQGKPSSNISWGYDEKFIPVVRTSSVKDVRELPIINEIWTQDKPVSVPDTSQDSRWIMTTKPGEKPITSYLGVPVHADGKIIGILNLNHYQKGVFVDQDTRLLQVFANQLGQALHNAGKLEDAQRSAMIDPLTELPNRRKFMVELRKEIERAVRGKHQLCLIICDIDRFSDFNDFANHQAGDEVFKQFAAVLKKSTRDIDTPARGGEGADEFTIILPETDKTIALVIAQRIQQELKNLPGVRALKSGRSTKHQRDITEDETLLIGSSMGIALLEEIRNYNEERNIALIIDPVQRNIAYNNLYTLYQISFYELADTRLINAKKQKGSIIAGDDESPPSPQG